MHILTFNHFTSLNEATTMYSVVHDGVDADHKSAKQFHGKKNVSNYITKFENSANSRAVYIKKKGFNNVRVQIKKVY